MKLNNRLGKLREYEFYEINKMKDKLNEDVIDLSIGDPDLPVNPKIINKLIEALNFERFNNYPPYDGIKELKKAIIKYYDEVYSVKLNYDEVLILIGSKEGICNVVPAICGINDIAIIPAPSYPVYENSCVIWGVNPYKIPLKEKENYLPHLSSIPNRILDKSKMFLINYPNNPTGAEGNKDFYKDIVKLCKNKDIILINDGAYNEIIGENKENISILQFDKEKKFIEFGSFSKTYNMTGFRIGYVVGNKDVIKGILKVKTVMDSSQFKPIQYAALEALKLDRTYIKEIRNIYDKRREVVKNILTKNNIKYFDSYATFYLWCKTPDNYTTHEFCKELMEKCKLIVTPGYAFGFLGQDHFRISFTKNTSLLEKGLKDLNKFKI